MLLHFSEQKYETLTRDEPEAERTFLLTEPALDSNCGIIETDSEITVSLL